MFSCQGSLRRTYPVLSRDSTRLELGGRRHRHHNHDPRFRVNPNLRLGLTQKLYAREEEPRVTLVTTIRDAVVMRSVAIPATLQHPLPVENQQTVGTQQFQSLVVKF